MNFRFTNGSLNWLDALPIVIFEIKPGCVGEANLDHAGCEGVCPRSRNTSSRSQIHRWVLDTLVGCFWTHCW